MLKNQEKLWPRLREAIAFFKFFQHGSEKVTVLRCYFHLNHPHSASKRGMGVVFPFYSVQPFVFEGVPVYFLHWVQAEAKIFFLHSDESGMKKNKILLSFSCSLFLSSLVASADNSDSLACTAEVTQAVGKYLEISDRIRPLMEADKTDARHAFVEKLVADIKDKNKSVLEAIESTKKDLEKQRERAREIYKNDPASERVRTASDEIYRTSLQLGDLVRSAIPNVSEPFFKMACRTKKDKNETSYHEGGMDLKCGEHLLYVTSDAPGRIEVCRYGKKVSLEKKRSIHIAFCTMVELPEFKISRETLYEIYDRNRDVSGHDGKEARLKPASLIYSMRRAGWVPNSCEVGDNLETTVEEALRTKNVQIGSNGFPIKAGASKTDGSQTR